MAAKTYRQFANKAHYPVSVCNTFRNMVKKELEHDRIVNLVLQAPVHEIAAIHGLSAKPVDEKLRLAKALLASAEQSEMSASEAVQLAMEA